MDTCGSHTAAWHASLDNQIAGMSVYDEGYAQVGGSKRSRKRRSKRSRKLKRKIKKGGYPQWFDKVPKNMSRKKYLKEQKKKSKKRSKYLKKKSKIGTHKKSRSFRR